MAFLDSTGEQILGRGDSVIVGDFGHYRLGTVVKVFMIENETNVIIPGCAVRFFQEPTPVIYFCRDVTKLTTVGSIQWIRLDCIPPDALPKPGTEIMVLAAKTRHYRLAKLLESKGTGIRFLMDGERYKTDIESVYVKFVVEV